VLYTHNGTLFSPRGEWNYVIWIKMDGTGDHNVDQNKPSLKTQISHAVTQMWDLDLKQ
jgi:hypothetical protein